MMKQFTWQKLGLICTELPSKEWSKSHLQFPAVLVMPDRVRIFVTTRPEPEQDGKILTYISFLDVSKDNLFDIIGFSDKPVIPLGSYGEFDQFGTMPGDFISVNNKIQMFYTGWNRLQSVPYCFSIGLAESYDGGNTFLKYSNGPVMGQSVINPYTCGSGATILKDGTIHMYYISGIEWIKVGDKLEHTYSIRHASSEDGINWNFIPDFVISPKNKLEAIAAPTVIQIDDTYHMWFSYRGSENFRDGNESYRIGYAYSKDLYSWIRDDNSAGIDLSDEGWDSTMICYPYVFKNENEYFMVYNGNSFGKNSLGLAKLII